MGAIISTHIYQLTEQQLFDLLRNSFVAGENYHQNWSAEQTGEIEETTEPDFGEWYVNLELEPSNFRDRIEELEEDINNLFLSLTKDRNFTFDLSLFIKECANKADEYEEREVLGVNNGKLIVREGFDEVDFTNLSTDSKLFVISQVEDLIILNDTL